MISPIKTYKNYTFSSFLTSGRNQLCFCEIHEAIWLTMFFQKVICHLNISWIIHSFPITYNTLLKKSWTMYKLWIVFTEKKMTESCLPSWLEGKTTQLMGWENFHIKWQLLLQKLYCLPMIISTITKYPPKYKISLVPSQNG